MADVDVLNIVGETVSQIELLEDIFNVVVDVNILHEVVVMQMARRRAGTVSVKGRGDVKGSTKKLFRQKGTGRARRGGIKSPLLRGGGVVFGPSVKKYDMKMPKKIKRLALKMALSSKYQSNALVIVDHFSIDQIKTRAVTKALGDLKAQNALIVTSEKDENLEISSRNIPYVKILRVDGLNVYDILKYESLILLKSSVPLIEERLVA